MTPHATPAERPGPVQLSAEEREAQKAWIAYRNDYQRRNYLNARQAASQMRRREFIAGYLTRAARDERYSCDEEMA